MKVCYITEYDATEVQSWSGIGYNMHRQLSQAGVGVELIGNLKLKKSLWNRLSHRVWGRMGLSYLSDRDPKILRDYARQIESRLAGCKCDVIVSPGSLPTAYLQTQIPVVFWTDATFANLLNYYEHFTGLSPVSIWHGHKVERRALARAALAVFSSNWAASSAIHDYGASPDKVKVIPFGANLRKVFPLWEVLMNISTRKMNECRLLFIGVDWIRKGGAKALETARCLESLGVKVRLDIVGPKVVENLPTFAVLHGFLSKDQPRAEAKLDQLFFDAHFLLLPTKADCVPVAIAEANVRGVPVITHDTGGVSSVVTDGRNGFLFPIEASARDMAWKIRELFSDVAGYRQLCQQSCRYVADTQNWSKSTQAFIRELERVVTMHRTTLDNQG